MGSHFYVFEVTETVATRKKYMKRRYEEQKMILKAAKEAGIGQN